MAIKICKKNSVGKLRNAQGEFIYLLATLFLGFLIYFYICFLFITDNFINLEHHLRELSNRVSTKSLIKDIENVQEEFANQKQIILQHLENSRNFIVKQIIEKIYLKELTHLENDSYKVFKIILEKDNIYKIGSLFRYKPKVNSYIFIYKNF